MTNSCRGTTPHVTMAASTYQRAVCLLNSRKKKQTAVARAAAATPVMAVGRCAQVAADGGYRQPTGGSGMVTLSLCVAGHAAAAAFTVAAASSGRCRERAAWQRDKGVANGTAYGRQQAV
jgi:hypothetical protein